MPTPKIGRLSSKDGNSLQINLQIKYKHKAPPEFSMEIDKEPKISKTNLKNRKGDML